MERGVGTFVDTEEFELDRTQPVPVAPPVIQLDHVHKVYKTGLLEVEAVRGVSTTIEEGDYVAIMGPSGSGKSTLMHIIGCLDVPTSGTYRLRGEDVGSMSEVQLAHVRNRRIGFVFQQYNLLPSMTAWRNVELPLTYAGVDRTERRARAMDALERVGVADIAEHRPGEMSGGQQQRVAVARAFVTDPDLVLCDEPTGALDTASAAEVLNLLHSLNEFGRTVLVITHEADVAARAKRTLRIRDGLFTEDTRAQGTR
jgi:putative ABC transport system ATP-binding protein